MRKGLLIIDSFLLSKALRNQSGLIAFDVFIRVYFGFEDPFITDRFGFFRKFNQVPNVIMLHRIKLFNYGFIPLSGLITINGFSIKYRISKLSNVLNFSEISYEIIKISGLTWPIWSPELIYGLSNGKCFNISSIQIMRFKISGRWISDIRSSVGYKRNYRRNDNN